MTTDNPGSNPEIDRARFEAVFEHAPCGMIVVNPGSDEIFENSAAQRILGRRLTSESGLRQLRAVFRDRDGRALATTELPLERARRGDIIHDLELRVVRPDGSQIPILANAAPIRADPSGTPGAVLAFHDVSASKGLVQLRQEWTSAIAHDIRQPIAVIIGFAGLLQRYRLIGASPEHEAEAIGHIRTAAKLLDHMIGELSDVSRLESGNKEIDPSPVDMATLVRKVIALSADITEEHPVDIQVQGNLPIIWVDPTRIEDVVANLLANAAKYGDPGTRIRVRVRANGHEVRTSVANHGRGIPAKERERIFERFFRTATARKSQPGGLGLGLYIAKRLVETHGGRIWVRSIPDLTTTFTFSLPVHRFDKRPVTEDPPPVDDTTE